MDWMVWGFKSRQGWEILHDGHSGTSVHTRGWQKIQKVATTCFAPFFLQMLGFFFTRVSIKLQPVNLASILLQFIIWFSYIQGWHVCVCVYVYIYIYRKGSSLPLIQWVPGLSSGGKAVRVWHLPLTFT